MTVCYSHGSVLGGRIAVGVFQCVQRLLYVFVEVVKRLIPPVSKAHVDHEQRFRAEVFRQLQHLVEAQSVAHAVVPVHVTVTGSCLDAADSLLPFKTVMVAVGILSLYVTPSGEAHEGRFHVGELLRKVWPATVFTPFEGRREEADDVHAEAGGTRSAVGYGKLSALA